MIINRAISGLFKSTSDILVENTSTNSRDHYKAKLIGVGRLNAIPGARGVGKTTLLLQYMKQNHHNCTRCRELWFSSGIFLCVPTFRGSSGIPPSTS